MAHQAHVREVEAVAASLKVSKLTLRVANLFARRRSTLRAIVKITDSKEASQRQLPSAEQDLLIDRQQCDLAQVRRVGR